MGQSIVVTEKPSSIRGVVRFETNRALTGMDHERYVAGQEVWGERPPDELARRLFRLENVAGVQVNSNMVTVDLHRGYDSTGIVEVIENLYRFYPDADEVVDATAEAVAAEALAPDAVADADSEPVDEAAPAEDAPTDEPAPADEAAPAEDASTDEAPADETAPAEADAS